MEFSFDKFKSRLEEFAVFSVADTPAFTGIADLPFLTSAGGCESNMSAMTLLSAHALPGLSWNLGLDLDLSEPMHDSGPSLPIDVSDAEFFAQFDKDANAALPELNMNPAPQAAKKGEDDSDNLIDFDAFDVAPTPIDKLK